MNMWHTKDDVLKDLAECTGVPLNDLDDDYIVRGSRPPPPAKVKDVDDEEFNLRFGGCGDHLSKGTGPDLVGITNMLRMVDTFDRPQQTYRPPSAACVSPRIKQTRKDTIVISKAVEPSSNTKCDSPKSKNDKDQINIQSKLNPNVSEFVPKYLKNGDALAEAEAEGGDSNYVSSHTVETNTSETKTDDLPNKDKLEGNKQDTEKQKMVALLKSKISANSKETTVERKRDKNVALAALLRLNSGLPVTPSSSSTISTPKSSSPSLLTFNSPQSDFNDKSEVTTPLVLFTPDYFAGPTCSPKIVNVDDIEHNIPEPKPPLERPLKTPSPQHLNDPQIRESINKVTNWLNSPKKITNPKTASPHVGLIPFKKKESITPKSPSSEASKKTEPLHVIPSFKPSQYASELENDFKARVKSKEEKEVKVQPPVDMWTKLEMDLKARDKVVKDRLRQAQDQNEPDSSAGSSNSSSRKRSNKKK